MKPKARSDGKLRRINTNHPLDGATAYLIHVMSSHCHDGHVSV